MKKLEPKKRRTNRSKPTKEQRSTCQRVQVLGLVTWTEPMLKPAMVVLETDGVGDDTAKISLAVNFRNVASIELRALRTPMDDVASQVADAERLANKTCD